jgi:hypothetical protein
MSAAHSTGIASFSPFAVATCPQLLHTDNHVFAIAAVLRNLGLVLSRAELLEMIRRQATSTATEGPPIPRRYICTIAWTAT